MKELKPTIEYLGRYKTLSFYNIFLFTAKHVTVAHLHFMLLCQTLQYVLRRSDRSLY